VGNAVKHLLPSDYRLALQALNKGRPLALDNHSKLAAAYKTFARALAGLEPGAKDQSQAKGSIFGLFRQ